MSIMEFEPVEFLANYSYFSAETYIQSDEFAECSWGVSCSSLSENSSQNSIQGGSFLGGEDLLELDMLEALGFDPINPDFFAISMDQNVEEMGSRIEPDDGRSTRPVEENVLLKEEGDSFFKGIQAELMEEDSLTDLLLEAAEAVEAQNQPLASDLIEKLKKLLCDDGSGGMGSSFNRLAWFFTQGLHYRSFNIAAEMADRETGRRLNNSMSAFQMLQELSPYIKFAHFTANQAILEAAEGERTLHVIDYNIMEGIQWPPLMADLAARKDVCFLRLTAIVQDHENDKQIEQTGRRLSDFAASINFPFIFDQVTIEKEEHFSKIQVGQTLIANCSNILQHILSHRNLSKLKTFLGGIAKLSPKCIVLVEEELFKLSKPQSLSFVEFFFEAFHHFSALSESLLKCFSSVYESGFRQLMEEFLGTRILDSVSQFPSDANNVRNLWRDTFDHLKGYNKIPFSSFNHSQAKYLISLFRGDFWVQHEKCRLTLCWKSKPLCAATIWVPRVKNGAKV